VFTSAPRPAAPMPLRTSPISNAGTVPNRAMSSEPGTAAIANIIGGRLESQPIAVSDRCRSACSSGTTGGIARTVSRRHAPASQSSASNISRCLMIVLFGLAPEKWCGKRRPNQAVRAC
jgi:hypothetical protein